MKHSQLKAIIKEIVTQVMSEMPQQPQPQKQEAYVDVQGWKMFDDETVEFKGVLLPDDREVDIFVSFSGDWDDGAFQHAFGTHRYPLSFETNKVKVTYAIDTNTHQDIPIDPVIAAAGTALFDANEDSIRDRMEPPSNEPNPDDQRDRDLDR